MPSQSVSKATRRDLRRAMGAGAVQVIEDHERALQAYTARVGALTAQLLTLREEHADLQSSHEALTATVDVLRDQRDAFLQRSFSHRLRWLVKGR